MEIRRLRKKSGGPKKGKANSRRRRARRKKWAAVEDLGLPGFSISIIPF
jgi:hypothetical protein